MRERRTVYEHKGYRLRSYTELLWARALDAVDIFYLYEPHLQKVEGGKYLPDFYLQNVGIYVEVKGTEPNEEEFRKADDVIAATGKPVVFLVGKPESDRNGLMNCGMYVKGACGWNCNISPHDLGQLVRDHVGIITYAQLLLSVRHDDMDYVRHISEVIEEYMVGVMDRNGMESYRRMIHKRANEARLAEPRDISIVEKGLKYFFDTRVLKTSTASADAPKEIPNV